MEIRETKPKSIGSSWELDVVAEILAFVVEMG